MQKIRKIRIPTQILINTKAKDITKSITKSITEYGKMDLQMVKGFIVGAISPFLSEKNGKSGKKCNL